MLDASLQQAADLIARWHGRDGGRLRYAVTPRFAVSCTPEMLRRSADLAHETGTYWQTHIAEDRAEIDEVARLFPDALDYTDVYDRAGGLGPHTLLAHAIHLSDREVARLAEAGVNVAHCPASNLFLRVGRHAAGRYLDAGLSVGLGSDVAGGPDLSIFRRCAPAPTPERAAASPLSTRRRSWTPLEWLRARQPGRRAGARARRPIGSLEAGKEADLIVVDPAFTAPMPGVAATTIPTDDSSAGSSSARIPSMVRGAWVAGPTSGGPAESVHDEIDLLIDRRHDRRRDRRARTPRRRRDRRATAAAVPADARRPEPPARRTIDATGQGRRARVHRPAPPRRADDPRPSRATSPRSARA